MNQLKLILGREDQQLIDHEHPLFGTFLCLLDWLEAQRKSADMGAASMSRELLAAVGGPLDHLATLVANLAQEPGRLVRAIGHPALRHPLDHAVAMVFVSVLANPRIRDGDQSFVSHWLALDTDPSHAPSSSSSSVANAAGIDAWHSFVPSRAAFAQTLSLVNVILAASNSARPDALKRVLMLLLDHNQGGVVTRAKFLALYRSFGRRNSLDFQALAGLAVAPYFAAPFVSLKEAERWLEGQAAGSFLLRVNGMEPDAYALAHVRRDGAGVGHLMLLAGPPGAFRVELPSYISSAPASLDAPSLMDLVRQLMDRGVIGQPAGGARSTANSWFVGELSSGEAEFLLKLRSHEPGTYVVRMSSAAAGLFVASYLNNDGTVQHARFSRQPGGFVFAGDSGAKEKFATMEALIAGFKSVLKYPLIEAGAASAATAAVVVPSVPSRGSQPPLPIKPTAPLAATNTKTRAKLKMPRAATVSAGSSAGGSGRASFTNDDAHLAAATAAAADITTTGTADAPLKSASGGKQPGYFRAQSTTALVAKKNAAAAATAASAAGSAAAAANAASSSSSSALMPVNGLRATQIAQGQFCAQHDRAVLRGVLQVKPSADEPRLKWLLLYEAPLRLVLVSDSGRTVLAQYDLTRCWFTVDRQSQSARLAQPDWPLPRAFVSASPSGAGAGAAAACLMAFNEELRRLTVSSGVCQPSALSTSAAVAEYERRKFRHKFDDGSSYDGMWLSRLFDGQGTHVGTDQSRYVGRWRAGQRQGQGAFYYAPTELIYERYEGEFTAGKFGGRGALFFRPNVPASLSLGISWLVCDWTDGLPDPQSVALVVYTDVGHYSGTIQSSGYGKQSLGAISVGLGAHTAMVVNDEQSPGAAADHPGAAPASSSFVPAGGSLGGVAASVSAAGSVASAASSLRKKKELPKVHRHGFGIMWYAEEPGRLGGGGSNSSSSSPEPPPLRQFYGAWERDRRSGVSFYSDETGTEFSGEWQADRVKGKGTMTLPDDQTHLVGVFSTSSAVGQLSELQFQGAIERKAPSPFRPFGSSPCGPGGGAPPRESTLTGRRWEFLYRLARKATRAGQKNAVERQQRVWAETLVIAVQAGDVERGVAGLLDGHLDHELGLFCHWFSRLFNGLYGVAARVAFASEEQIGAHSVWGRTSAQAVLAAGQRDVCAFIAECTKQVIRHANGALRSDNDDHVASVISACQTAVFPRVQQVLPALFRRALHGQDSRLQAALQSIRTRSLVAQCKFFGVHESLLPPVNQATVTMSSELLMSRAAAVASSPPPTDDDRRHPYEEAVRAVRSMVQAHTPRHKMRALALAGELVEEYMAGKKRFGADDLLPVLCFVLTMAEVPHLHAEFAFVEAFMSDADVTSAAACFFTHFSVALGFLSSEGSERAKGFAEARAAHVRAVFPEVSLEEARLALEANSFDVNKTLAQLAERDAYAALPPTPSDEPPSSPLHQRPPAQPVPQDQYMDPRRSLSRSSSRRSSTGYRTRGVTVDFTQSIDEMNDLW